MIRVALHVHPGSKQQRVGGSYNGALSVYVKARAVDGAATESVLGEIARAFNVRPREVRLVRGATSREKVIEILGDDDALQETLSKLLED